MAVKNVSQGTINSPSRTSQTIKVLVIEINPILTTVPGNPTADEVIHGADNVDRAISEKKDDFETGSDGYYTLQITRERLNEFPTYTEQITLENGSKAYRLDEQSYLTALTYYETGECDWWEAFAGGQRMKKYVDFDAFLFDYNYLINKFDLINRRNNGEFDWVWIVTIDPLCGFESCMVGRNAYYVNGDPIEANCDPFVLGRTDLSRLDSSLHGQCHFVEQILDRVYVKTTDYYEENTFSISTLDEYMQLTDWEKFVLNDFCNAGTLNGVGAVHFPWNGGNYDYDNQTPKNTTYTSWENCDLDNMEYVVTSAACEAWIGWSENTRLSPDDTNDSDRLWNRFWLYLMPKKPGYTKKGYLKNWFKYIYSMNFVSSLSNSSGNISCTQGDTISLPYTAKYYLGETENGIVEEGSNVDIKNTNIINFRNGTLKALSPGSTYIYYYRDGKSTNYYVTVNAAPLDTIVPRLSINSHGYESGKSTTNSVTLTIINNAPNTSTVTYYYSTDGSNYTVMDNPEITIDEQCDTTYYFYAENTAGISSAITSISVKIDRSDKVKPVIAFDTHGYIDGTLTSDSVYISVYNTALNTGHVAYYYSSNNIDFNEISVPDFYFDTDGIGRLYVYAVSDGGVKSDTISIEIAITSKDIIQPQIQLNSHGYHSGDLYDGIVILTISNIAPNTDEVDFYYAKDSGNFVKLPSSTMTFTDDDNGIYKFMAVSSGGVSSSIVEFIINLVQRDKVKPILHVYSDSYERFRWAKEDVAITIDNIAENTEQVTIYVTDDGEDYPLNSNTYIAHIEDGNKNLEFYGVSNGGTISDKVQFSVCFDIRPPEGTIQCDEILWNSLGNGVITDSNIFNRIPTFSFYVNDSESGVASKQYYISLDTEYLTPSDLEQVEWTSFTSESLTVKDTLTQFVVYLRVEDYAGNVGYVSTSLIIVDKSDVYKKGCGFNYYGMSTKNIIGTPLILVAVGSVDFSQALGVNRNIQAGDITISRPINNEYGTINGHLQFTYALIKSNLEPFTENEQMIVEAWLTSPKLSSTIGIYDCDGIERFTYYGLFTNTTWINSGEGNFAACVFTFSVNGSYPYQRNIVNGTPFERTNITMTSDEYDSKCILKVKQGIFALDNQGVLSLDKKEKQMLKLNEGLITITDYYSTVIDTLDENEDTVVGVFSSLPVFSHNAILANYDNQPDILLRRLTMEKFNLLIGYGYILQQIPNDTVFDHVRGRYNFSVVCLNQEYEEYCYPTIEITPYVGGYLPEEFSITNTTDNFKAMTIKLPQNAGIKFDCKNCMVTELNTNVPVFSFKDLGWEDVGKIYWMKLKNGLNMLKVSGSFNVKVIYNIVRKKVGGWLI